MSLIIFTIQMKLFLYFIAVFFFIVSCKNSSEKKDLVQHLFQYPKNNSEVSGITYANNLIWSIQDSGNTNEIFGFDTLGKLIERIEVKNIKNTDWEAITSDKEGNLYIGDFGNNDNDRKDLAIYKLASTDFSKAIEKITFYYPEQTDFPAKKRNKLFDCEAFFYYQNAFYLFTKNRSKGFDGTTLIYKIPATEGHYSAKLIGKFKTCSNYNFCVITGAAISSDNTKVALLGHDRVWVIEQFSGDDFLSGSTISSYEMNHLSQKEGICFKDDQTLYIADERAKKTGGNLYEVSLTKLKSSH